MTAHNSAIKDQEKAKKTPEGRRNLAEKNNRWLEKIKKLFDDLEAKGRIKYRIYIEIEGKRVDVVRTKPTPE